jgi:hypothetical protein
VTTNADTAQTAATEINDILFNLSATKQWASNTTVATERHLYVQQPTDAFASAGGTVTTDATVDIQGPPLAGTNAAITNAFAFRVESGAVDLGECTVSQATNINTGVTCNGATGLITTQSASTAARTAETGFTVTNSAVVAASVVIAQVQQYSGTLFTNGFPQVVVTTVASGSFTVKVVNTDSAALSGTMKIAFHVL